jgi:hypothetical protein
MAWQNRGDKKKRVSIECGEEEEAVDRMRERKNAVTSKRSASGINERGWR